MAWIGTIGIAASLPFLFVALARRGTEASAALLGIASVILILAAALLATLA